MAFPDKKPKMAVMIGMDGKGEDEPDRDEGEFTAPEGIDLEGKKPGDMIELVAECEIKEDGKLCVRKVNGMDVPGYEDEKKPPQEEGPDEDSFASAVKSKPEEEMPEPEPEAA